MCDQCWRCKLTAMYLSGSRSKPLSVIINSNRELKNLSLVIIEDIITSNKHT